MEFRPCIDIHDGLVKQIVGSTLSDATGKADENYTSDRSPVDYADLFRKDGLTGGHVILLNRRGTDGYAASFESAKKALSAWPGAFQVGGGITSENAGDFLAAGAGAVIVTSFLFEDGTFSEDRLHEMEEIVGAGRLVIDLSAKKAADGAYHVAIDRWQTLTETILTPALLEDLSSCCAEFLIHGTAVEGKKGGIDEDLVKLLGTADGRPCTYAGGIRDLSDIDRIGELGKGKVNFTVGSALDIYGGSLPYGEVVKKAESFSDGK